jgi:MFS transporter, DHA2 family, multidrug resistance protein
VSAAGGNKWLVAAAAMLATILEVLDVTIGNVALPHMQASFSASVDEVTWVLTSYLVSNGIVVPLTGWLSTLFGRKRFFMTSTVLFTLSSMLCGIAWNLQSMVAFRILQGVGGAAMIPMSQAVLMEAFPPAQHGLAMAVWGMGLMAAPILGPALGGWITDNYSWRWIYYVNLPFGIVALLLQWFFIPESRHAARKIERIDYFGLALVVVTIGALQIVLDRGERADWFAATWVWISLAMSMSAFVTLIWWELRYQHPVIDLSLFRHRAFAAASAMSTLLTFSLYGSLVTWPLYLQQVMGYPALQAGLAMAPRGLATMAAMFVVGQVYGKIDTRFILLSGFLLVALGSYQMAHFTVESSFWTMVKPSLVHGLGMGFTFVPLSAAALSSVPPERIGNASGLYNLMRNTGASVGIAVAGTFIVRRSQLHQAILGEHVNPLNPLAQLAFQGAAALAASRGAPPVTAEQQATAMIYGLVQRQAAVLAFSDVFLILTFVTVAMIPFLTVLGRTRQGAAAAH